MLVIITRQRFESTCVDVYLNGKLFGSAIVDNVAARNFERHIADRVVDLLFEQNVSQD